MSHESFFYPSPGPQKDREVANDSNFATHCEQTMGQLSSLTQQEGEKGVGCVVPLPTPPPIRHTAARAGVLGVST